MNAKFKLVFKQSKMSPYFTVKTLNASSKAKINEGELEVEVSFNIPDSLFKRPVIKADIILKDPGTDISASVTSAIKELIEDKFNVDVKISR